MGRAIVGPGAGGGPFSEDAEGGDALPKRQGDVIRVKTKFGSEKSFRKSPLGGGKEQVTPI